MSEEFDFNALVSSEVAEAHRHHNRANDRRRYFSDADIEKLVETINEQHSMCRFGEIGLEDMRESIKFYKNFNRLVDDSGNLVWKTILVTGIGGGLTLIWLGIISKIRQAGGG